jgi:hypothetical protein
MMHRVRSIPLENHFGNYFFILGLPDVWYLFILATDNGTPQRQCMCDNS